MSKQDLLAAISADKDLLIDFLQVFLQAPSPNPPGETEAAARVITDYLSHHNISTSIIAPIPSSPNITSTFSVSDPSNGPTLVMNGHLDVFPVLPSEQWVHPPWSGAIENGRIYGRGVVDMKAGTAATVAAYSYLHRFRSALPRGSCVLEVVSDEETGGKFGTKYLLMEDPNKETWRGDVVLNAEPTGLQSIRFGEKGTLRMTFTVRTLGVHGAYTHLDEGAIRISARLITRLLAIEDMTDFTVPAEILQHLQRPDVQQVIDEIMGPGAHKNMLRPTVNAGTIKGGSKVNTVPSLCVFEMDIRLPIGLDQAQVLSVIDEILEDGFPQASYEIQQAASNPPNHCSPSHPLATAIADNALAVLGRKPLPISSMGATDSKFFRYIGVPAYSFGVSPEGMAGVDESVALADYLALIKVLAGAAWDFLGGE